MAGLGRMWLLRLGVVAQQGPDWRSKVDLVPVKKFECLVMCWQYVLVTTKRLWLTWSGRMMSLKET